ncbi:MAG TPA: septum formation inhibitor Maf [Deltaproteobacteria bacterium]|nr:septum formation inhibitor Maf [Deltaproteobacteria bacterium]
MQIILASGSPRRRELFSQLGLDFKILIPHIDETPLAGELPEDFCSRISMDKAMRVSQDYADALVIAADTIVVIEGRILGKPADSMEATEYLMLLSNRMHDVYTGYTIMNRLKRTTRTILTRVHFKTMSEEEIFWYVSTGEPMDKAGAYAVQGAGSVFIDRIEGSYTNVIGLPLSDLYWDMKDFGLNLKTIEHGRFTYG